ncbi:E3 ubiquitin-protein ligase TOM1-like [Astathelohania contejeani]|uniref:HECT-type E3 ubiquitin transferase n=1 Tax=Astathelohania contejeani TaxID=164912 RepID=A0ABQ7HX35_9MICR|nr:E3 ubiquitin-protein ligase TOM1-like [Thelohania contejeani]
MNIKLYLISLYHDILSIFSNTFVDKKECDSVSIWYNKFYDKINWKNIKPSLFFIDDKNILNSSLDNFASSSGNYKLCIKKNVKIVFSYNLRHNLNHDNTNEWVKCLSLEYLKNELGLFNCINKDKRIYEPNYFNRNINMQSVHDKYILFGRMIGIILKKRLFLPFKLPHYVFKLLLCEEIDENDIIFLNKKFLKNVYMIKNKIKSKFQKRSKCVQIKNNEIKENKSMKNRYDQICSDDFVDKSNIRYCPNISDDIINCLEIIINSIKLGLLDTIDSSAFNSLSSHQLEILINGSDNKIVVEEWRKKTYYLNIDSKSDVVKWFWRYMKGLSKKEIENLYFLFTGLYDKPLGGLVNLEYFFNISSSNDGKCHYIQSSGVLYLAKSKNYKHFKNSFDSMVKSLKSEIIFFD